MRLLVSTLVLAAALAVTLAAPAGAAKRSCSGTPVVAQLKAKGATCPTARRIASEAAAIRRSTARFAAARRCSGDFCIVVYGWRCRPAQTPEPRERCTRARRTVFWLYR